MDIYIVNTGSLKTHDFMRENSIKMMHLANSWRNPIDKIPYALDNGAYHCWNNGKPFDDNKFISALEKSDRTGKKPEFVVCPDIVAGGLDSLAFSLAWLEKMPRDDYYLAVQDGMSISDVEPHIHKFKGLFVGGTLKWKLRTSSEWVKLAHNHNRKCHIGRVGTFRRLLWAKTIGADSVDSSNFVQNPGWLNKITAFKMQSQLCFNGQCNMDKGNVCESCGINPFRGAD